MSSPQAGKRLDRQGERPRRREQPSRPFAGVVTELAIRDADIGPCGAWLGDARSEWISVDPKVAQGPKRTCEPGRTATIVAGVEDQRIHPKRLVIGDAFGQILLACQAGGGVPGVAFESIERSDGHLG